MKRRDTTSPVSPEEREAETRRRLLEKELRRRLRSLHTHERRLAREVEYLEELEAREERLLAAHEAQIATVEEENASRFSSTKATRLALSRLAAEEARPTWTMLRMTRRSLVAARRRVHLEALTTGTARRKAIDAARRAVPTLG